MPPSVNNTLMPIMGKVKFNKRGKPYASGRMVKSNQAKDYEADCIYWSLGYKKSLDALKAEIIKRRQALRLENKELTLKIEFFAVFAHEKLFTVNNKLEPLDSDNRLKPAKDAIFTILCLDDKHVFRDEIEKITGDKEQMIVRITEYQPKTHEQVKAALGIK